ncbi:MAG: replication initiation factor domain-containing protein, partial [Rhodocyclaceae bacterium]|nr:replication initiation factor domain-containing protein [Rhodocyclaceae bacterium]
PDERITPHAALIDWLSFTVTPPLITTLVARLDGLFDAGYRWMCFELHGLLDIKAENIERQKTGGSGYKYRAKFPGGYVLWGGANQNGTVHVSLSGEGCARIKDWSMVHTWLETNKARLTRVDLASDDFTGETYTVDKMRTCYDNEEFGAGGRKPTAQLVDDLGSGKGRTLYVGARQNGKLFRCYEKGKQLGAPKNPWVRIEVEWHNKSRVLPYDMLTRPGQYLAGAYPCLGFLNIEQSKIKTIFRGAKIAFERAMDNARQAYGKLVNLAVGVYGGDFSEVVKRLIRDDGYPSRIEAYSYHIKQNLEALAQPFGMMPNYAE